MANDELDRLGPPENRLTWATEFVAQFCRDQGLVQPHVLLRNTLVAGMKLPVTMMQTEFNVPFSRAQVPPELRISEEAISSHSNSLLRFELAFAVLWFHAFRRYMSVFMVISTVIAILLVAGFILYDWAPWVMVVAGLLIPAEGLLLVNLIRKKRRRLFVDTAMLTGEPSAAIELLNLQTTTPTWHLPFMSKFDENSRRKEADKITEELSRAGLP